MLDRTGVTAGAHVLDVGAGDGNLAIAAAQRGATVVATDLSPEQVNRGAARSLEQGVDITWQVADVEELPFDDGSFSHVLSAFAAVVAPHPDVAAREMFRVCRPGGAVALTAWPPDSFMAELAEAVRSAAPAAFPFPDQDLNWGAEDVARARLAPYADDIVCSRLSLPYDSETRGAAGQADFVAQYFNKHLSPSAAPAVGAARDRVMRRFETDGRITAEYLLIVATAR